MGMALPDLSNLDADALRQLLITQHHEFHEKLLSRDHEIEHDVRCSLPWLIRSGSEPEAAAVRARRLG